MSPAEVRSHPAFATTRNLCHWRRAVFFCVLAAWPRFSPGDEEKFQPPLYEIHRTATPIKIDGKLDEPAWFAAPLVGAFHFTWYKEGRQERSVAKLLSQIARLRTAPSKEAKIA